MAERAWRKTGFSEALAREDLRDRARRALEAGPLCDACLGRLFAQVDTGLTNSGRGRRVRHALGAPPADGPCAVCHGLFDALDRWTVRAEAALREAESDTFAVGSHADPRIAEGERALWDAAGAGTAEPYKQAFNRRLGTRLWEATGREVDLVRPEVLVLAHHRTGRVTLRIEPLYVAGGYRKLVRGLPQCRWRQWPTSIQEIVGDPLLRAAGGEDHRLHGCGREDTDVRCLGRRPFILEVREPRRRRLDWDALAREINASGRVEVDGLAPCARAEVARLKGLRPDKTYRAAVELDRDVPEADLARLGDLTGVIRQRTPTRVLRRRSDRTRRRRVRRVDWKRLGPRRVELTVRAQAGTYIKELVSGDGGRTRPSVADLLGAGAECAELDVLAIHNDQ
ncbi:MAG: tRNA pseudouridine(54/55) synthase Pus10 [Phycisphaerae bacterium]